MAEKVGIVGVGLMGTAMCMNLRKADFAVQGYDIDGKRMDILRGLGGKTVDSPAEAARGVRWLITSLLTSDIVREAVLGPNGVVEGAEEGLIIADTTTARPEDSEAIAVELAGKGIRFLDSAVSGTSTMAQAGDLIVMVGGDKKTFDEFKPCFDGFSRQAYYMGASGSGARTKIIVNLVLGGNRLALAEGLLLGMKAEMDMDSLLEVLQDGACSSKTMFDKGPKMIQGDYSPQGQIKTSYKDSRLMLEQGQKYNSPMLMTSVWSQILQTAYNKGFYERDTVSFIEVLRGMGGLPER